MGTWGKNKDEYEESGKRAVYYLEKEAGMKAFMIYLQCVQ